MQPQPDDPFYALAQSADDQIDLARGALLIAQDAYPDLDLELYLEWLDRMAAEVQPRCTAACTPIENVELLNQYMFTEQGFTGSRSSHNDPRDSYLNQVLERRTGVPASLAVIYLEIGRRLGLPLAGLDFPGRFLVKYELPEPLFIDPFEHGRLLEPAALEALLDHIPGQQLQLYPRLLDRTGTRRILARLLRHLQRIYLHQDDLPAAIRAAERITWLLPDHAPAFRDLGYLYDRTHAYHRALAAFEAYLRWAGDAPDTEEVRRSIQTVSAKLGKLN